MILEEGTIITLEDGFEYVIIQDLGEIETYPGNKYYFAAGITADETIKMNDIIFLRVEREDEDYFASKVDEKTEEFAVLISATVLNAIIEEHPEFEETIYKELDKYIKEEGS